MGYSQVSSRVVRFLHGRLKVKAAIVALFAAVACVAVPATASAATVSACETKLRNVTAFPAADRAQADYNFEGGYGDSGYWHSRGGYVSIITGHAICEGEWRFNLWNGGEPFYAYRYQGDYNATQTQFTWSYEGRYSW